jgi:hypothetical protein
MRLFRAGRSRTREHGHRRAHAATAHQLVKAVRCGRDAKAKEQQYTGLAVQLARPRKGSLEALDLGGEVDFVKGRVGHGELE